MVVVVVAVTFSHIGDDDDDDNDDDVVDVSAEGLRKPHTNGSGGDKVVVISMTSTSSNRGNACNNCRGSRSTSNGPCRGDDEGLLPVLLIIYLPMENAPHPNPLFFLIDSHVC